MTFLPIVDRELRLAARRKGTFYLRGVIALVSIVMGGMILLVMLVSGSPANQSGVIAFRALTIYLYFLCLLAGVFLAADCLSEERREGTLGLLFLTELKGYDIVLGKLLAVSLNAFYGLLAVFPIMGLSLVIGGVEGVEFGRVCLALCNALWFSVTLALWASACSDSSGRAMLLTTMALVLAAGLLPAATLALGDTGWSFYLTAISPTKVLRYARAENYVREDWRFWTSLAVSGLAGWMFLALASWKLERFTEAVAEVNGRGPFRRFWNTTVLFGRKRRKPELLEANPVAWLLDDSPRLRALIWTVCGLSCVASVASIGSDAMGAFFLPSFAKPFYFGMKLLFIVQACRFYSEARRTGALEMLSATPLPGATFSEGQFRTLRSLFFAPVAMMMLVEVAALLAHAALKPATSDPFVAIAIPYQLLTNCADFPAMAWVGMWIALTAGKPQLAVGWTVLFVLVLPAVAICVPNFLIALILIGVYQDKMRRDFRLIWAEAEAKRR